jgi:hypothetical protein
VDYINVRIAQIRLGKFELKRLRIGPVAKLYEKMLKVPIPNESSVTRVLKFPAPWSTKLREEDVEI